MMAKITVPLHVDDAAMLAHGGVARPRTPLLTSADRLAVHRVYGALAWSRVASWETYGNARRSLTQEPT